MRGKNSHFSKTLGCHQFFFINNWCFRHFWIRITWFKNCGLHFFLIKGQFDWHASVVNSVKILKRWNLLKVDVFNIYFIRIISITNSYTYLMWTFKLEKWLVDRVVLSKLEKSVVQYWFIRMTKFENCWYSRFSCWRW